MTSQRRATWSRVLSAATELPLEQPAFQQLLRVLSLLPCASHPDGSVSEMCHSNLGKPPKARHQPEAYYAGASGALACVARA